MQIYLTSLNVDVGLPLDEAEQLLADNKAQIENYGSRIDIKAVGFYVRRQPVNVLGTGRDKICLVTATMKVANDGGKEGAQVLASSVLSSGDVSNCRPGVFTRVDAHPHVVHCVFTRVDAHPHVVHRQHNTQRYLLFRSLCNAIDRFQIVL